MDLRQRTPPAPAAQHAAPVSLADIVAAMPPKDAPQPSDIGLLDILRLIGVQMGVQDQPQPRPPVATLGVRG